MIRASIVTAFNRSFAEIGNLCCVSLARYRLLHPQIRTEIHIIPDDYEREPSWFKVRTIIRALEKADIVLWIDADALIVGDEDFRPYIADATLNICFDANGINCGVMAWRNCGQAIESLERMEASYRVHPWFEQAALMDFVNEVAVHELPKTIFNAYPGERTEKTMICHWPGMQQHDRLAAMRESLK